jgi:hypothetical protein
MRLQIYQSSNSCQAQAATELSLAIVVSIVFFGFVIDIYQAYNTRLHMTEVAYLVGVIEKENTEQFSRNDFSINLQQSTNWPLLGIDQFDLKLGSIFQTSSQVNPITTAKPTLDYTYYGPANEHQDKIWLALLAGGLLGELSALNDAADFLGALTAGALGGSTGANSQ